MKGEDNFMDFYEKLCAAAGEEAVRRDEPMNRHTTFRTGGTAEFLVQPNAETIGNVLALCRKENVPCQIIGNGSNLLVGDKGISGVVVEIGKPMSEITVNGTVIRAQAGALMSAAASRAAGESLTGLEFASGIPGSVGGAVTMNAGAYGGEMKDVLTNILVLCPDGSRKVIPAQDLDLSYRHSILQENDSLVLEAELHLEKGDPKKIEETMNDLKNRRISKQPLEYPSAGSTFKRPEGFFAGKLIEDAGLRGYTVGGAQVSEKHCGFVINRENATSAEILQVIRDVQRIVKEKSGVTLEPEVRFIGEF